jgi:acyl-coenzyme A thioesterase PaaI-like protein
MLFPFRSYIERSLTVEWEPTPCGTRFNELDGPHVRGGDGEDGDSAYPTGGHGMRRAAQRASSTLSDLEPEEGWEPLDVGARHGPSAFLAGSGNGSRLRVRYFRCLPEGTLAGKVWFGPNAEGPPRHAHGGSISAVLDEAMEIAVWLSGHTVLAATLSVHFREVLPLGLVCTLGAWISTRDGDKLRTRGLLASPGGQLFAEGEGLYAAVDPSRLGGERGRWSRANLVLASAGSGGSR